MKLGVVGVILLALVLVTALPWDTGITEVAPSQVSEYLRTHPRTLVLFYVTWCPWCRKILPIWKRVNDFLIGQNDSQMDFVQVQMDKAAPAIQEAFDVRAYPKLTWFEDKTNATYDGNRSDFNTLIQWIYRVSGKGEVISVRSLADFKTLLSGPESIAIYAGNSGATKPMNIPPQIKNHLLTLQTNDQETIRFLQERMAITNPEIRQKTDFVSVIHPFGNDDELSMKAVEPGDNFDFFDQDDRLEHMPYSAGHVDHSARLWDPRVGQIEDFIQTYLFPVITRWNSDSASRILEVGRPMLIAIAPSPPDAESLLEDLMEGIIPDMAKMHESDYDMNFLENILWEIGSKYRRDIVTVQSGTRSLAERRLIHLIGGDMASSSDIQPMLVYITLNPTGSGVYAPALKYVAPDHIASHVFVSKKEAAAERKLHSVDQRVTAITNWLDAIRSKKIEPTIKSEEPLGKENNPGPVYHLTALEFQREVISADDVDYIVDFFAPWCGHCRVLAPIYEQAAQAFRQAGYKHVKFGKMDATANEVLGVPIRGYPTLILYPSHNKNHLAVMKTTPQSPQQIIHFIVENVRLGCTSELVFSEQTVNGRKPYHQAAVATAGPRSS